MNRVMNKLSVKIITVCILLVFCSCDYMDNKLMIINETNRPLFFYSYSHGDSIERWSIYSPYKEISGSDTFWIKGSTFIEPMGENRIGSFNIKWEHKINRDGGVYIFIFEADTLEKYDWEDVRKNN